MKFDPAIHHRRSIRLKGFDYKTPGAYFVTVCAFERAMLFGEIVDDSMRVNTLGEMVHAVWYDLPKHYGGTNVDAFIVMPNHVHGIIWITGAAPRSRPNPELDVGAGPSARPRGRMGQAQGPAPTLSLADAVQRFKSLTSARFRRYATEGQSKLWQRNYYEHVVRNQEELNRIREYILTNPLRWPYDRENPARVEDEEEWHC